MRAIHDILEFWFSESSRCHWFAPTAAFDQEVRKRFAERFAQAATGALRTWEDSADGCLALCILLDQMARNMFRGRPQAFATDARALAVAEQAVSRGLDRALPPERKQFLYLPFMHSEEVTDQLRALALFESAGLSEPLRYAEDHLTIIRRFGRFPHRNAILGRASTPEELAFLAEHRNDYGQRTEHGPEDATRDPEPPALAVGPVRDR